MTFRSFVPWCAVLSVSLALTTVSPSTVRAQVVQMPSTGTFSLSGSASVPDGGSAYLGGNRRSGSGSTSRGPLSTSAFGSQASSGSASVHATIIDLDELDRMIRSQTGTKSATPTLNSKPAKPSKFGVAIKRQPESPREYEYLSTLSHLEQVKSSQLNEDARYYLSLANDARQKGHWHAVELYYKLAWESLPEKRRDLARQALAKARTEESTSIVK
jgi:hypothetical protein